MFVSIYGYIHTYSFLRDFTSDYILTHIRTYAHICAHIRTYSHIFKYLEICLNIYEYIYKKIQNLLIYMKQYVRL